MCASETRAIATSPRAARGATRVSHAANPGTLTGRPPPSLTTTVSSEPHAPRASRPARRAWLLSGSTVGFVRLDDLLHQRVPDDVLLVEVDECDAGHVADHLDGLDESRRASGGKVDLGQVARDNRL